MDRYEARTRLYEILGQVTQQARKGEVVVQDAPNVTSIFALPALSDLADEEDLALVDCHFITVAVRKAQALALRDEIRLCVETAVPEALEGVSYITMGGALGDQGTAFQLFALGEVCGFWTVLTPARLHIPAHLQNEAAGNGYVLTTPYSPDGPSDKTKLTLQALGILPED